MSESTITTETATEELSLETVVEELTAEVFGESEIVTPYMVAKIVNSVFETMGNDKRIPPQMMYNYSRNGMINKVKGSKAITKEETITFVTKYTRKYI